LFKFTTEPSLIETYLLDKIRMSFSLNLKPERVKLSNRLNLVFLTGIDIVRISNLLNYYV